ncbi:MAG: D-amino acid dehydrogenase [Geminicoccaceae bacterium]
MASGRRVLVLGGGIIGVTTAYALAKRGFEVTVVERQDGVGLETSFANGSLITPSMADPWAAPGLPLKLLKWIGREESPFLIRLATLPGMMSWGLKFLANCNPRDWKRNTEVILRIAQFSQHRLAALTEETGIGYDQTSLGTLRLFRDEASMADAKRSAEMVGELGVPFRLLDAAECAALDPALSPSLKKIAGGIHFPGDQTGDAFKFTNALAELCREAGVAFRCGETVDEIDVDGDQIKGVTTSKGHLQADHYVIALGSFSAAPLRQIGIKIPVYPVKGYSLTIDIKGWNNAPTVPLLDDGKKIGIVRLGDRLRLAGTAEFIGFDASLNPARGANLVNGLRDLFPDCPNVDQGRHWAGLRPMTPDGIPILGRTPFGNLYLNVGHGHLGWTMAAGSGEVLAALVAGEPSAIDLEGMTLDRR